jgi:ATP-dependent protease HslVU (ClpYQ) ATPase subunit
LQVILLYLISLSLPPSLQEKLDSVAAKFAEYGFVGRDVTNSIIALTQAAYASKDFAVSGDLIDRVVGEQIAKKLHENACAQLRSQRISDRRAQAKLL